MDTPETSDSHTERTVGSPSSSKTPSNYSLETENISEEPIEHSKEPKLTENSESVDTDTTPNDSGVFGRLKNLVFSDPKETNGQWYRVKMRTLVHTVNEHSEKEIIPLKPGEKAFVTEINGRKAILTKPVQGWCNATSKKGHVILELIQTQEENDVQQKGLLSRFSNHLQAFSRANENSEESNLGGYCVVGDHGITVRETEALDSKLLGTLHCGMFVNVVELKGRRAKIDRPKEGWVSLHNADKSYYFLEKRKEPILQTDQLLVQVEALRNSKSNLEKVVKRRDRRILILEQEIEQKSANLKSGMEEVSDMEEQLKSTQEELETHQVSLKKAWKSNENYERLFRQRELDMRELSSQTDTLERENASLLAKLAEMEKKLSREEVRRKEAEREAEKAERQNLDLKGKIQEQIKLIAAYHYKAVEVIREKQNIVEEIENLRKNVEEVENAQSKEFEEKSILDDLQTINDSNFHNEEFASFSEEKESSI